MARRSTPIFWLTLVSFLACAPAVRADDSSILALEHVTVVDVQAGRLLPDQTVVWQRSRIMAAGPSKGVAVPPGAQRVDGKGRFVMPGLWDMHVHVGTPEAAADELTLPMFIAHGVTAVRDMSDYIAGPDYRYSGAMTTKRWDAEARAGLRVGPRVVSTASLVVDGPGLIRRRPQLPAFLGAGTPEEARELVRYIVDQTAVDTIKVYSGIPRASFFALMDEARLRGITVVGHKPLAVDFIEAVNAGQRSIEHAREILLDSFPGAAELQRDFEARQAPAGERDQPPAMLKKIVREHDPKMLQAIFAALKEHDAYYVPTHLTRRFDWLAVADDRRMLNDPRLQLIHPTAVTRAMKDVEQTRARASGPEDAAAYKAFFDKGLEVTRLAYRAGVNVMAGTDTGDSFCFPGSALLEELELMASSGLSPAEVLRAATITPARYANRSNDFGAVAAGRVADLLVLDGDPLSDIRNVQATRMVVFNGRLFDRAALDRILTDVAAKARSLRKGE
ncbi:amidohydrolase family protein [Peristeroidobacter soli]|jgi:imidazolonepropionase-like amidohydrolase|uniref:amidohydrolase family protein n=1 Tax=Peristeroidobacter soli TaxID=2497877 RepID=UPI00101B7334|nr:amidohydrolase family protein [Peristeroidobacter soli]